MPKNVVTNELKQTFSKNLTYYMQKNDVKTADLARALSYPFTTVSDWVHGRKYPRMDKVQSIADYFDILKSDLTEERCRTPIEAVQREETTPDGLQENEESTLISGDGLTAKQKELIELYEAAAPALRVAALAVLRSGEEPDKAPDEASIIE